MPKKTMICRALDGFVTISHSAEAPAEADWNAYCELVRSLGAALRGGMVLVPPTCPGPNASQRKSVTQAWSDAPGARLSVITTSRFHRAIMTALCFFVGDQFRPYGPAEWQKAFGNVAPLVAWPGMLQAFEQDLRELGSLKECIASGIDPGVWARSLQRSATASA
jgi:hypothetical protein